MQHQVHPRTEISLHKLGIPAIYLVQDVSFSRSGQIFLQNFDDISQNEILVHEQKEEAKHEAVLASESELLVSFFFVL